MKKSTPAQLCCIAIFASVTILMASSQAMANPKELSPWQKIDDFENPEIMAQWFKADTKNQTKPKVENPQITERKQEAKNKNHYLIKKPAAEGVVGNRKALTYRALPQTVEVGETYTFYLRFQVEHFPNNHIFGLSNMGPDDIKKHDYNAFEPSIRITDKAESNGLKNDGALMVKIDGAYSNIFNYKKNRSAKPLVPGQWYELWYVVNNAKKKDGGQVYDVYLRGSQEFSEQALVYKNATFRMARDQDLIYFLANCNTGSIDKPYGNGGVLYDDLYMTKGIHLTSPLGEI